MVATVKIISNSQTGYVCRENFVSYSAISPSQVLSLKIGFEFRYIKKFFAN